MARKRKVLEMRTGDLTRTARAEKLAEEQMIVQDPQDLDRIPQDLADRKAKQEWLRVVPDLKKLGIVGKLDVVNLVSYCNSYSKYCEATKALKGQPLTVPCPSGEKENPLINVQIKYMEQARKSADQCGLSINSRLKWATTKRQQEQERIESEFGDI